MYRHIPSTDLYICVCVCVCVCVCRKGAHTVHPIAMKLLQVVVKMLAVALGIKKIKNCSLLTGVSGGGLHSDLDEILYKS